MWFFSVVDAAREFLRHRIDARSTFDATPFHDEYSGNAMMRST
jgi:hypothetical protein